MRGDIYYAQSRASAAAVVLVWTAAVFAALIGILIGMSTTPGLAGVPLIFFGLGVFFRVQVYRLTLRGQPWLWPLPGVRDAHLGHACDGSFGFRRKHEIHTGVDIYCEVGQEVCAVADGRVLLVTDFTGEKAGSPWWNPTSAVLVEHDGRVVVYGELAPLVRNDDAVRRGQVLGKVLRVRKEDDGTKPMTMLHLELWASVEDAVQRYTGANATVANDWPLDGKWPKGLLDPTPYLKEAEVS